MARKILLVEDNPQILMSTNLLLSFNDYETVTATNGKEALSTLYEMKEPPDMIVSDIMMPEMDGYEFYKVVSETPRWINIPFIFLTAKATPEDVRFGKTLGINDYITKPFDGDELLASIEGKINRSRQSKRLGSQIEKRLLDKLNVNLSPSCSEEEQENIFLIEIVWDETFGPQLQNSYPSDISPKFNLAEIGAQLFQTTISINGYSELKGSQGILLNISNIKRDGYLFFDSLDDTEVRGGKRQFMLAVLAPKINYLESLRIREILELCADGYKSCEEWDVEGAWSQILEILTTPSI